MSLPMARARRWKVPSIQRSPNSSTCFHSRTESSKPRAVMSQASWSSATSQSSLISRSSPTTRCRSSSRESSAATMRSTAAEIPRSTRVFGMPWHGERVLEPVDVAALDAERVGELAEGRAAPDPQLAVLTVAEELVAVAAGAGPRVEHGLAVLDHQHGVAGLVAGEVGVRRVGAELVVGVVGPHLERAGGQHQPLAGEHPGQLLAAYGGAVGHRLAGQVELAVAPAGPHEGGVGLGDGRVVGLDVQLSCGLRVVLAGRAGGLGCGLLAHARHSTPERGSAALASYTPRHGRTPP